MRPCSVQPGEPLRHLDAVAGQRHAGHGDAHALVTVMPPGRARASGPSAGQGGLGLLGAAITTMSASIDRLAGHDPRELAVLAPRSASSLTRSGRSRRGPRACPPDRRCPRRRPARAATPRRRPGGSRCRGGWAASISTPSGVDSSTTAFFTSLRVSVEFHPAPDVLDVGEALEVIPRHVGQRVIEPVQSQLVPAEDLAVGGHRLVLGIHLADLGLGDGGRRPMRRTAQDRPGRGARSRISRPST